MAFRRGVGPFVAGVTFALGLGISGMTESKNIIAFLDIFGDWQGELMLVMGGALLTYGICFQIISKKTKPFFESDFNIPADRTIDKKLLLGSLIFGLGWGITGLCPGPGIVGIVSGSMHAIIFCLMMLIGLFVGRTHLVEKLFLKN